MRRIWKKWFFWRSSFKILFSESFCMWCAEAIVLSGKQIIQKHRHGIILRVTFRGSHKGTWLHRKRPKFCWTEAEWFWKWCFEGRTPNYTRFFEFYVKFTPTIICIVHFRDSFVFHAESLFWHIRCRMILKMILLGVER